MKPNESSLAQSFGLNNASLNAIKKQEHVKAASLPAVDRPGPMTVGPDAFAFRTRGLAEFFQRKPPSE